MASLVAFPVAGSLSVLLFFLLPVAGWAFAVISGWLAWREMASRALATPPQPGAAQRRFLYVMVSSDPLLFGPILWILWSAVVDSLETGGGLDTVGASFRLFVVVAGSFSWAAWGVAISQSVVFREGLHDYIGRGFSRVQAILVLPSLAAVFALVLGFLASDLARDILADPTAMLSSRVDAITMGFVFFTLAIVAVPVASVVAMRRDVTTAGGFRRGLLVSIAGIVPGLVVFAWLCLQLIGR